MITVEEAKRHIQTTHRDFGLEEVVLDRAIGRVLREDWFCDRDLPPYDRVTMDGIAAVSYTHLTLPTIYSV